MSNAESRRNKGSVHKKKHRTKRPRKEHLSVHVPQDYPWKVLSALADDLGYLLTDSEQKRLAGVVRSRDHAAYLSLSEDWGPQCMSPSGELRARASAKYQIVSLLKKFRFPSGDEGRKVTALEKFKAAEAKCAEFNRHDWRKLAWIEDDQMLGAFTHAKAFLAKVLGDLPPSDAILTHWSRHGPGANLDTKERRTSSYDKYAGWPYSCTSSALGEAKIAVESDPRWLGALEADYRDRFNVPAHRILDKKRFWSEVFKVVPGNRITFVPKDARSDRSIAIEPAMNLWLQLGIDGYIRRRLKRWDIDLDSQKKNRELARLGSLHWDSPENYVTLDLAAASDTISVGVCKLLLPRLWFNHLMKLRSPCGLLGEDVLVYDKISSMGNGFTFALESAIFAAVIYGCYKQYLGECNPSQFAVFGDDLIVLNTVAPKVITLLNLCGFTINPEKSFLKGPFRESCGADWLDGTPVRPVFLELPPCSVMELWNDLNRLMRTLSLRFQVEKSSVESLLEPWIPEKLRGVTGPCSDETFDSYRHVPAPTRNGRREGGLWRFETLVARPVPTVAPNFFFRKLMHDLREHPAIQTFAVRNCRSTWRGLKVSAGGSRFTVPQPNAVAVDFTDSVAEIWRSEYAEV